jgi:hypothetical protein
VNFSEIGRDAELERLERDSFVYLQHVYTISERDPAARQSGSRMNKDLGFTPDRGAMLLDHLIGTGYLAGHGPMISITPEGVDYIERLAWRRRSVRAAGPEERA